VCIGSGIPSNTELYPFRQVLDNFRSPSYQKKGKGHCSSAKGCCGDQMMLNEAVLEIHKLKIRGNTLLVSWYECRNEQCYQ